jgi:VWFA-related protein
MAAVRSLLVLVAAVVAAAPQTPTRTVYVTASAADGSAVTGLTAADVIVKESGQPRAILHVEPSRAKLQVAIIVEEILTPDNDVRRSVANFIDHVRESGALALYTVGRRTERRVDYTSEILPFANAINRFPVRAVAPGDLVQALQEIARDQRGREGRHAIVAVATQTAQVSTLTAEAVLEQLTAGRAVLYAATLAGSETSTVPFGATSGGRRLDLEGQVSGLERDKIFGDATRQSGGLHLSSQRTAGLWAALERIAAELQHQYVVSYDADARADGTLAIESARRGLIVRGPMRAR